MAMSIHTDADVKTTDADVKTIEIDAIQQMASMVNTPDADVQTNGVKIIAKEGQYKAIDSITCRSTLQNQLILASAARTSWFYFITSWHSAFVILNQTGGWV